jgi:hypothetical protein
VLYILIFTFLNSRREEFPNPNSVSS